MKNKKTIMVIVLGILLTCSIFLATSYSIWLISHTQTTANKVSLSCFETTFTDENNINLSNQFPIADNDGIKTKPYTFTIKNTCNVNATYSVNLETLKDTTADAKYIKVSLNSATPDLLNSNKSVTPTITDATSAYELYTGFLAAGKEISFNLRLWITADTSQEAMANKKFDSKVVVVTTATNKSYNYLNDQLIANAGGKSTIEAKTTPDFTKTEPVAAEYKDNGFSDTKNTKSLSTTKQAEYYTYADSYTFDKTNGTYSLVNPQVGKYSDIYSTLIGKYVVNPWPSSSSTAATSTELTYIYKITDAPYNASASVDLKYNDLVSSAFETASVVSYDSSLSGMYAANDDYGTSYYYRGKIDNNNVLFGGYCWKVIRINGNGTTRMIYNGTPTNGTCVATGDATAIAQSSFNTNYNDNAYVGYMYGAAGATTYEATHANTNSSTAKTAIDAWYKMNLSSYASKISDTEFCDDRSIATTAATWDSSDTAKGYGTNETYYGAYNRYFNTHVPKLTCQNKNDRFTVGDTTTGNAALTYPIGLITLDEVNLAGATIIYDNNLYYLYSNSFYWTISSVSFHSYFAGVFNVIQNGSIRTDYVGYNIGIRPVINLTTDTLYTSGDGTSSSPYVIS